MMPAARPLRACMLAYTFYETDGRVMRYAEALQRDGAQVDAIVLRRAGQSRGETIGGVRVLRIQERQKNESGKLSYLLRIVRFFVASMVEITRRHLREPYDIIHVHSVPDFEVFAAWLPKLLGAKLILDIHDIVPEFYAAKFRVAHDSLTFRALQLVERLSGGFADHVITANDLWFSKITQRSVRRSKCSVFINYPDLTIFDPALRRRGDDDGRFVITYPGTLNWHQGLDLAIRAIDQVRRAVPEVELHIYGEGPSRAELAAMVDTLGLQRHVVLHAPLPLRQIAAVMADADLGVVPKRNDAFGGEAFSTKILEFMAVGTPLVVAATRIDTHYFDDTLVNFFVAGDADDLAEQILRVHRDRPRARRIAATALDHARRISWARKSGEYLDIVRRLAPAA